VPVAGHHAVSASRSQMTTSSVCISAKRPPCAVDENDAGHAGIDRLVVMNAVPSEENIVVGVSLLNIEREDTKGLPSQISDDAPRKALLDKAQAEQAIVVEGILMRLGEMLDRPPSDQRGRNWTGHSRFRKNAARIGKIPCGFGLFAMRMCWRAFRSVADPLGY